MITGFNTDIRHAGVTYHVQTEDKGLDSPLILSLVYVGGAIIASKRTHYDDLIQTGFDEKVLTERLQRQHKLICAAIRAGRVEELKRMGERDAPVQDEAVDKNGRAPSEGRKASGSKKKKSASHAHQDEVSESANVEPVGVEPSQPVEESNQSRSDSIEILTSMMDEISALSDTGALPSKEVVSLPRIVPPVHEELPVESSPAVGETNADAPSQFDEQPQQDEPTPAPHDAADGLYLNLLEDEGDFRAGQLATIKIHVGRGTYGQRPVFDASVTVKVLGTTFRPMIFTTGTDERGIAVVRALLPRFTSGRAAIIIRAVAADDAAEMRRIIHQA